MMKTPEEIKQAMEICTSEVCPNDGRCPYAELNCCADAMTEDGLAYIQQLEVTVDFYCNTTQMLDAKIAKLESRLAGACGVCAYNFTGDKSCLAHIKQLESRLAQVERERDAAVRDLTIYGMCAACKHGVPDKCTMKDDCMYGTQGHFEWRGVCEENTKEEK